MYQAEEHARQQQQQEATLHGQLDDVSNVGLCIKGAFTDGGVFDARPQIVLFMPQRQLLVAQWVIQAMVCQLWYSLDMLQVGVIYCNMLSCWVVID